MKKKVFSKAAFDADLETTKPQTIANLDHFFKETETGKKYVQEFEDVLSFPTTAQFQTQLPEKSIGKILGNSQIQDLELPHIPLRDTLVHPEFTLPGLTWKGTEHYDQQLRKQVYFHYDYAMLRGPSHPDMDLLLHRRSPSWRKDLMQKGINKFHDILPQVQLASDDIASSNLR